MNCTLPKQIALALVVIFACTTLSSCKRDPEASADRKSASQATTGGKVVVYTSVDEQFAREVLDKFQKESGIELSIMTDTEASKTTGLVNKIEAEAKHPRADVFWSSEVFNTILMARKGLFEPYEPSGISDIPDSFIDPQNRWTGCSTRARVMVSLSGDGSTIAPPTKWEDLANPEVASKLAYANPLFGTTRGHIAAMYAMWGPEKTRAFLESLRDNGAMMVDGNSTALRLVLEGKAGLCATDTDDARVAEVKGAKLTKTFGTMGESGTLLIPCTVALIKGGPNPEQAKKVVDFLVSAEVERMLALSDSYNYPVRQKLREELGMETPSQTSLTFDEIANAMDESTALVREILIR